MHNFKNIYNVFLNKKIFACPDFVPNTSKIRVFEGPEESFEDATMNDNLEDLGNSQTAMDTSTSADGSFTVGNPEANHVKTLYLLEHGKLAKFAHKLSDKVMNPSSIEKTNVMLADSFFHESTIAGLEFHANRDHPEFKNTVPFLKLIRKYWNIVNVKNPLLSQRKRNKTK